MKDKGYIESNGHSIRTRGKKYNNVLCADNNVVCDLADMLDKYV